MIVVDVLVAGGGFSLWVWIFCAEIDFEWVSQLGLSWFGEEHKEWSSCSRLEVSGFDIFLGWRFDDFSRLVFSCGFGFDEFFMFWRFRWRIGILYEILRCSGFDCSWVWEEHEEQVLVILTPNLKNNESNKNNNKKIRFKSFFFNLVWIKLKLKNINYFYFFN